MSRTKDKSIKKYECKACVFFCSRSCDWERHIITKKHKIRTNNRDKSDNSISCECGKKYKHASSLWNHKKKCNFLVCEEVNESKKIDKKEISMGLIKELIKENVDLRNLLVEQNEKIDIQSDKLNEQNTMLSDIQKKDNVTINQNNTQNNKFSINMFLNEKCKDAINFTDFIERIEITYDDLINNAQLGFAGGISKILMDNLKQFNLYERPIHYTDIKREIMYIRDEDKWQKDDTDQKIEDGIKEVSRKSIGSLLKWKQENPEYSNVDSDFSNKCIEIQQQSSAGMNKNSYPKIKTKIAKENIIHKENMNYLISA